MGLRSKLLWNKGQKSNPDKQVEKEGCVHDARITPRKPIQAKKFFNASEDSVDLDTQLNTDANTKFNNEVQVVNWTKDLAQVSDKYKTRYFKKKLVRVTDEASGQVMELEQWKELKMDDEGCLQLVNSRKNPNTKPHLGTIEDPNSLVHAFKEAPVKTSSRNINVFGFQNMSFSLQIHDILGIRYLFSCLAYFFHLNFEFLKNPKYPWLLRLCVLFWEVLIISVLLYQLVCLIQWSGLLINIVHRTADDGLSVLEWSAWTLRNIGNTIGSIFN
jgi:hypothetical protein